MNSSPPTGPPALSDSPIVLLAVLVAARRSGDRVLERLARRRLEAAGVRIAFGDELSVDITTGPGEGRSDD